MTNKILIRKQKILERDSISLQKIKAEERKITSLFINLVGELRLKKIGLYFSVKKEIPTSLIFDYLFKLKIKCYLPVINQNLNNRIMNFCEYDLNTTLVKNKFGIPEPSKKFETDIYELDLVLIPLVAFDKKGYRIGMGKGYYDTTFSRKDSVKNYKIWGICYDFQETDTCYPEEHDLKMDAIIRPSGIQKF